MESAGQDYAAVREAIDAALSEYISGIGDGGIVVGYITVIEFAATDGSRWLTAVGPDHQPTWYGRMYANEIQHHWRSEDGLQPLDDGDDE